LSTTPLPYVSKVILFNPNEITNAIAAK